jgi:hypothetical protein
MQKAVYGIEAIRTGSFTILAYVTRLFANRNANA